MKGEVGDRDYLSIWFSIQILLTTLAFIGFLFFLRKRTSQEYTEWDVQTTTISDYTMQYEIPEAIFNDYKERIYRDKKISSSIKDNFSSPRDAPIKSEEYEEENLLFGFKIFLKNEFEKVLTETEPVKSDDKSLISIAHIHLGFDHTYIHSLLESRGSAIKNGKVEKKEKLEKQIVDYIDDNKVYLSTPKDAYIIFETEEAYHRAMKYNSVKKCGTELPTKQWRGTNLILKNVKEPSNISFESKYKSRIAFIIKVILVAFILVCALVGTCYLIFFFQDRVNRLNRQYPEVSCDAVVADSTPEMLNNYAMLEYFHYESSDKSDETILMLNTDNLQCFCDNLSKEKGYLEALNHDFNVIVLGHQIQGKVCNDYLQSAIFIQATAVILPLMIIIFNVILKEMSITLVEWLHIENKTVNIAIIQSVVFILMFFNSALAILLINANIEGFNDDGVFFNGLYSDFSDDWFDKISMFFITPMFVQLIFPINAFLPGYVIQKALAMLDRNFSDPKLYKTKCNLAYDYADLNSGTEHLLYEKYPRLLNIIFVSSFYGFGLPLLPILIFICLIISYFVDRFVVAFYHRKPPLYDDTLNVVSIHLLKWAAFWYIAIAFWMLTNKQIFGNDLKPIAYQAQIEYYDHYIFEIPDTYQECVVLAIALLILAFLLFDLLYRLFSPFYETSNQAELMEFEDLPPFSRALDEKSLDFWVTEEKQIRDKYNYKYLFDDFFAKIRERHNSATERKTFRTKHPDHKEYISDATNYDLLYQNQYSHSYAYIPVSRRRGEMIDNDSNFTRRALDFPYHQETQISFYDPGRAFSNSSNRMEETKQIAMKKLISRVVV